MSSIEALEQRARWEIAHARPYFAYRLYLDAWSRLSLAAKPVDGPRLLNAALDLCLDYLDKGADEIVEVTDALLSLSSGADGRALSARGVARSLRARAARDAATTAEGKAEALALARRAEADLVAATTLVPFDADAWGSLGGLYKRLAGWARADGAADDAAGFDHRMLEAYRAGMQRNRDAYTALNYFEYRAVVLARGLAKLGDGRRGAPCLRMLRNDAERAELSRALEVRRQQFQRHEDAPWAAFDLARGQHHLEPDVYRFLSDLGVAVADAHRVARTASDRWMVETAQRSLRDLYEAGYPLDGVEEALLLLGRAATADGWIAGHWEPLVRAEDYLVAELHETRAALARLAEAGDVQRDKVDRILAGLQDQWSREDEERFQKALEKFKKDVEPPAKKHLRVLWKLCGEKALEEGMLALPALLLGGPLPAVGAFVARYAVKYLGTKIGEAVER